MKLVDIKKEEFPLWKQFRKALYKTLDEEYNAKEIENIYDNDNWHCQFIQNSKGQIIGLVELSLRNIVDGCLSSPVAYLEGLYLIAGEREKGQGTIIINLIKSWCRQYGYTELATDTEIGNIRAQSFYSKLGFEEVDRVVEYRIEVSKIKNSID